MILADFVSKRLRFLGLMPYEFSRKVGLSVGNVVEIVSGRKIHVTTRAAERFAGFWVVIWSFLLRITG